MRTAARQRGRKKSCVAWGFLGVQMDSSGRWGLERLAATRKQPLADSVIMHHILDSDVQSICLLTRTSGCPQDSTSPMYGPSLKR